MINTINQFFWCCELTKGWITKGKDAALLGLIISSTNNRSTTLYNQRLEFSRPGALVNVLNDVFRVETAHNHADRDTLTVDRHTNFKQALITCSGLGFA